MAIQYRDGWGIYAWHGQRIPDDHTWIITEKERITADAIMSEPNAELRRIMGEIVQWAPLLKGAKVLNKDEDGNGHPRRLLSVQMGGERQRVVEVLNGSLEPDGSRRKFHLGAMSGARTCHEAVAMSYGISPAVYREGIRT